MGRLQLDGQRVDQKVRMKGFQLVRRFGDGPLGSVVLGVGVRSQAYDGDAPRQAKLVFDVIAGASEILFR